MRFLVKHLLQFTKFRHIGEASRIELSFLYGFIIHGRLAYSPGVPVLHLVNFRRQRGKLRAVDGKEFRPFGPSRNPGKRAAMSSVNAMRVLPSMVMWLLSKTQHRLSRLNALLGCATGLLFLLVGGTSEGSSRSPHRRQPSWLSSYTVRIPKMWRQAPITAAIIIAAGLTHHSKLSGVEIGLTRVGEVLLGCVVGLLVTWLMSKIRQRRKRERSRRSQTPRDL